MKALPIITTVLRSGHNPGDTFIGIGMQWMLEQVAGRELPWHLVSKFEREETAKPDTRGYTDRIIAESPLIVYGGMPQYNNYSQWKFRYDDEYWSEVLNPTGADILTLAGGSGCPGVTTSPEAWAEECANDSDTVRIINQRTERTRLFTVRDRHAKALLDRLGIESHLIPCTAIYAGEWGGITYRPTPKRVAIVPNGMDPTANDAREEAQRWVAIAELVKRAGYVPVFLYHGSGERDTIDATGHPYDSFYSNSYHTLLRYYGTVEGVISARLHGSLTAWGIGAERVLNLTIDSRGYAVEEVGVANYEWPTKKSPNEVVGTFMMEGEVDRADRDERKDATLDRYRSLISPILTEHL